MESTTDRLSGPIMVNRSVIYLAVALLVCQSLTAGDWKLLNFSIKDDSSVAFYNVKSITKESNTFKVWIKIINQHVLDDKVKNDTNFISYVQKQWNKRYVPTSLKGNKGIFNGTGDPDDVNWKAYCLVVGWEKEANEINENQTLAFLQIKQNPSMFKALTTLEYDSSGNGTEQKVDLAWSYMVPGSMLTPLYALCEKCIQRK